MSVIAPQLIDVPGLKGTKLVLWETMVTGDTATPFFIPDAADMTVHIIGTFAGGTSISLTGSMVLGGTYTVLTDPQGNAITKTAAGIEAVEEAPLYVKPTIASGTADDIDVYLLLRKS